MARRRQIALLASALIDVLIGIPLFIFAVDVLRIMGAVLITAGAATAVWALFFLPRRRK